MFSNLKSFANNQESYKSELHDSRLKCNELEKVSKKIAAGDIGFIGRA